MEALIGNVSSANALLVFDVVARHRSITRAAEELEVTQVAVSRMIARLEKSLGTVLFLRARNGLTLTEDGLLLEEGVATGLRAIESAVTEIKRRHLGAQTVTLSLSSAFVAYWLMPRYQSFLSAFPDINLRFQVIGGTLHGGIGDVDLALRSGPYSGPHSGPHSGPDSTSTDALLPAHAHSWHFAPEIVVPLCSPAYLASKGPLRASSQWQDHALIELSSTTMDWSAYAEASGMSGKGGVTAQSANAARPPTPSKLLMPPKPALTFSDYALVLQAATLGQGLCLGWLSGTSYALRTGTLVPASAHLVRTKREYRLLSAARHIRPQVAQVKDWMIAEMTADLTAIRERYPMFGVVDSN